MRGKLLYDGKPVYQFTAYAAGTIGSVPFALLDNVA